MRILPLPTKHFFTKTNEVPLRNKNGKFNTYKCSKCGLQAFQYIHDPKVMILCNNQPNIVVENCPFEPKKFEGMLIRINEAFNLGAQWKNIKKNSVHVIIPSPYGYPNGDRGVWIRGAENIPIKIFFDECTVLHGHIRRNKF